MPDAPLVPLHVFRFLVEFRADALNGDGGGEAFAICNGALSQRNRRSTPPGRPSTFPAATSGRTARRSST